MFKGTEKFGTSDYAAEKPMLDEIERLFEVYRKTTDEAERAAIYHRIDSISYEASGHDRLRRGYPFEPDRQLG